MTLTSKQFNQLHLFRCGGIGPKSYLKLVRKFGSAEKALNALPELAKKRKSIELVSKEDIQKEIDAFLKIGGTYVFYGEENYPENLTHIPDPPIVLCVLGDASILNEKQVAVVGNRNASGGAMTFTKEISQELCTQGYIITSGLARGIDTAAHQGALTEGKTIAVLAGGVDVIYPPENEKLYAQIIKKGGAVISEMPLGMVPMHQHFPRRNRIISGLSLGTVVIEAPKKSGSLITARMALEQGREVFAVPGSPRDPRSEGPNWLIKQGATLVQTVEDITEQLPSSIAIQQNKPTIEPSLFDDVALLKIDETSLPEQNPNENSLTSLISSTPISVDELIRLSGLKEEEVITQLTEMDILGQINRVGGNRVVLA